MSLTASVPRSRSDASMPLRAITWPNSTQGHNGLLLCDTAAYVNGCSTSASCHFHDFGGNNHKYRPAPMVVAQYGSTKRVFSAANFPVVQQTSGVTASVGSTRTAADVDVLERVRRYVAAIPPAVAGDHGDVHTFRVCCRLVRGFALEDRDALAVLQEWNLRCQPPWSEAELQAKLEGARRYGREPVGGLLSTRP